MRQQNCVLSHLFNLNGTKKDKLNLDFTILGKKKKLLNKNVLNCLLAYFTIYATRFDFYFTH